VTATKVGDRVEYIGSSQPDPDPILAGEQGKVIFLNDIQVAVEWDSGRSLMLAIGPDRWRVLETN